MCTSLSQWGSVAGAASNAGHSCKGEGCGEVRGPELQATGWKIPGNDIHKALDAYPHLL